MASISEVLDYLTAAGLRDLVDALEIECEDRRQIATLRAAIIDTDVSVASVLEMLTVADLKFIAGEMGLTTSGRKADLIERIDNLDIDEVENNDLANSPEETPNKQNPTITKVSSVGAGNRSAKTEVELAVFKTWLQGALDTGTVEKGPINFGYCPACVRKHARQWFNYASSKHDSTFAITASPRRSSILSEMDQILQFTLSMITRKQMRRTKPSPTKFNRQWIWSKHQVMTPSLYRS